MNTIIDEITEDRSAQVIHKQVLVGQEFQPRKFYRIPLLRSEIPAAQRFLSQQFGESRPHLTWWIVTNSVFMESQIYTWWCLAHGVRG